MAHHHGGNPSDDEADWSDFDDNEMDHGREAESDDEYLEPDQIENMRPPSVSSFGVSHGRRVPPTPPGRTVTPPNPSRGEKGSRRGKPLPPPPNAASQPQVPSTFSPNKPATPHRRNVPLPNVPQDEPEEMYEVPTEPNAASQPQVPSTFSPNKPATPQRRNVPLPNVPQDEPEEMYEVPTEPAVKPASRSASMLSKPSLPLPDLPQQRESNISERPAAVVPQEEEEEEEVAYEEAENNDETYEELPHDHATKETSHSHAPLPPPLPKIPAQPRNNFSKAPMPPTTTPSKLTDKNILNPGGVKQLGKQELDLNTIALRDRINKLRKPIPDMTKEDVPEKKVTPLWKKKPEMTSAENKDVAKENVAQSPSGAGAPFGIVLKPVVSNGTKPSSPAQNLPVVKMSPSPIAPIRDESQNANPRERPPVPKPGPERDQPPVPIVPKTVSERSQPPVPSVPETVSERSQPSVPSVPKTGREQPLVPRAPKGGSGRELPPLPITPKTVSERAQPPLPITPKSEPVPPVSPVAQRRGPLPPVPPQQPTNEPPEKENLENFPWYYRNKGREEGDAILRAKGRDGVFLVRDSQRGGNDNPFTLALLFSGRNYNLHIRQRSDKRFALGTPRDGEKTFASISELISWHRNNTIRLEDRISRETVGTVKLIDT